ncbi:ABC transporter substrate-binding protein [Phycisphaeraceae bacterium D3-23]
MPNTSPTAGTTTLRIGHSPDPDDAFMWYPLANFVGPDGKRYTPKIDTRGYEFVHVLEDIQSLNVRSAKAELEITAISIHQYPYVAKDYALTSCGSSMGDGYGPMIVAPRKIDIGELKGKRIAIPGERTTAWLSFQLFLKEHGLSKDDITFDNVMFDEIIPKVVSGQYDAGLIIHEGQITYENQGLELVVDLGRWWTDARGLPLPLGGNCIRRDVGGGDPEEIANVCRILLDSIEFALNHREDAVKFALNWARDMGSDLADEFVGMYVNDWTLDYGQRGRDAVNQLLTEGAAAGLVPALPTDDARVDFVDPAPGA